MRTIAKAVEDHSGSPAWARLEWIDIPKLRFFLAMVLAPWIPAVITQTQNQDMGLPSDQWLQAMTISSVIAGYIFQHFLVLPKLRQLYRVQKLSRSNAALWGFASGAGVMAIIGLILMLALGIQISMSNILDAGMLGLSLTLGFVVIAGIPAQGNRARIVAS